MDMRACQEFRNGAGTRAIAALPECRETDVAGTLRARGVRVSRAEASRYPDGEGVRSLGLAEIAGVYLRAAGASRAFTARTVNTAAFAIALGVTAEAGSHDGDDAALAGQLAVCLAEAPRLAVPEDRFDRRAMYAPSRRSGAVRYRRLLMSWDARLLLDALADRAFPVSVAALCGALRLHLDGRLGKRGGGHA